MIKAKIASARELPKSPDVELTIEIKEVFKGSAAKFKNRLITRSSEAICGVEVVVPREYFFFVEKDGRVTLCGGSFVLMKAERLYPKVAEIRSLARQPKPLRKN